MNTLKRIKVLSGYAAHARFNAELADEPRGWIERQIKEPYRSGPTHVVCDWNGKPVIIVETAHRRYEVMEVSGPIAQTESELLKGGVA